MRENFKKKDGCQIRRQIDIYHTIANYCGFRLKWTPQTDPLCSNQTVFFLSDINSYYVFGLGIRILSQLDGHTALEMSTFDELDYIRIQLYCTDIEIVSRFRRKQLKRIVLIFVS